MTDGTQCRKVGDKEVLLVQRKKLGAETWKEIIQILVGWGNKEGGVQLGRIEKREHAEVQKGTKRAL